MENNVFITNLMKRSAYLCANVGLSEAKFGADFLKERARETGVPYLSANLVRAGGRKPVLPAFLVEEVGGLRVGILGLLEGPSVPPRELAEQGLEVRDPIEAAREQVPKLRKKCDLLVLAAYMTGPQAMEIAAKVPGIDLVLFRSARDQTTAQQVASTVFAPAGSRSGQITELDLVFAGSPKIDSFLGDIIRMKETGPRDEEVRKEIDAIVDRQAKERILASQKPPTPAAAQAGAGGANVPGESPATPATAPSSPELDSSGAPSNPWVNPWPAAAPTDFVGAPVCQRCHSDIFTAWEADPHARAFATLASTENWNSADCLPCHTTGYGIVAGSHQGLPAPEHWNVQCEACHGACGKHVTNPSAPMSSARAEACLACHTSQWSPGFDVGSAMKGAAHGH